jgi:hypothetical protein
MTGLERQLREQARMCRSYGSALTGALLEGAAADLAAGGAVADLLGPHADDPGGSMVSLRFAGSLHRLVLERQAPELALHYPSVGGSAPVEDVWPAAERACRDHVARLRELVRRPVQTNEVGRSAVLYGVLLMLPGPLRLLEVGASAGLNLRCDRYAYAVGDEVVGDPASPVLLEQPWAGPHPLASARRPRGGVHLSGRKGCDPNPLDSTTTEDRLTLTSYVWGDQLDRLQRLRGALEVAQRIPASVERLGALDFLTRELADPAEGATTVVWHSVVMQYVDPVERAGIDALLAAGTGGPVVRASMEPERDGDTVVFRVRLTHWPSGESVHVADAHGHGPPVRWTGATLSS